MFDKLIESSREGRRRATGPYLIAASTVYFVTLIGTASLAIMWFNPGLVEALELNARLITPPPVVNSGPRRAATSSSTAPTSVANRVAEVAAPQRISPDLPVISDPVGQQVTMTGASRSAVPGAVGPGVPGGTDSDGAAPPPPREAAPTPTPVVVKPPEKSIVSEGVLRGIATNRFTPSYPEIAKRAGVQGQVQVQVLISEDGRVIDATILNGHVLLRNTAREAATRWVFTPTKLSGVPVKVQGILTFDFKLN